MLTGVPAKIAPVTYEIFCLLVSKFSVFIGADQSSELSGRSSEGMNCRIQGHRGNYTEKEIERVSKLSRRLFSVNSEIDAETLEPIRAAAALSNCELKPNPDFSSHRPVIGKVIVLIKKLTWPLIRFHLHRQFDALSEYNRWMLFSQVKLFEKCSSSKTTPKA